MILSSLSTALYCIYLKFTNYKMASNSASRIISYEQSPMNQCDHDQALSPFDRVVLRQMDGKSAQEASF